MVAGNDVVLAISSSLSLSYEYYVQDVSAIQGVDYTDPNATSASIWAPVTDGELFPTIDTGNNQPTKSFAIHVRVVGDPGSEVVVEADIHYDQAPNVLSDVGYAYDPFDQLIRRTEDSDGPNGDAPATDTFFSWYNGQIVLQFTGGGAASNLSERDLFGPAVDEILAVEDVSSLTSASVDDVIWPLTNHEGTTNDLATFDTSYGTSIASHRVFDSYGILVSQSNSSFQIVFGFTGVYFDTTVSLQYNLHRWYDPVTGRWMSQDPTGLRPDLNPYRYVHNNPTDLTDPSGLWEYPPNPMTLTGRRCLAACRRALDHGDHGTSIATHNMAGKLEVLDAEEWLLFEFWMIKAQHPAR